MKLKILIIFIIILAVVIAAGAVFLSQFYRGSTTTLLSEFLDKPNTIKIQDETITNNTKPLKINIVYPQIYGLSDFNQKVKNIIDKEFNDFKNNSLANDQAVKDTDPITYAKYPREYELDIGYDKGEVDKNIVSVVFNVYNFEGGAHGASYFVPLNYNPKIKSEIKLSDLFPGQPDYLQKISDFCIKDLTKQIIEKLGTTDGTWIQDGAGPTEENFQFFLINPDTTITFYFPQYQVAFGAAGDFKVIMSRPPNN